MLNQTTRNCSRTPKHPASVAKSIKALYPYCLCRCHMRNPNSVVLLFTKTWTIIIYCHLHWSSWRYLIINIHKHSDNIITRCHIWTDHAFTLTVSVPSIISHHNARSPLPIMYVRCRELSRTIHYSDVHHQAVLSCNLYKMLLYAFLQWSTLPYMIIITTNRTTVQRFLTLSCVTRAMSDHTYCRELSLTSFSTTYHGVRTVEYPRVH